MTSEDSQHMLIDLNQRTRRPGNILPSPRFRRCKLTQFVKRASPPKRISLQWGFQLTFSSTTKASGGVLLWPWGLGAFILLVVSFPSVELALRLEPHYISGRLLKWPLATTSRKNIPTELVSRRVSHDEEPQESAARPTSFKRILESNGGEAGIRTLGTP